jgi:hypothetical protein
MHHFNVYLTDRDWTWVDEFWSAHDWGLAIGDIGRYERGKLYDRTVRVKRMS